MRDTPAIRADTVEVDVAGEDHVAMPPGHRDEHAVDQPTRSEPDAAALAEMRAAALKSTSASNRRSGSAGADG
jgi:hypothetical protein